MYKGDYPCSDYGHHNVLEVLYIYIYIEPPQSVLGKKTSSFQLTRRRHLSCNDYWHTSVTKPS